MDVLREEAREEGRVEVREYCALMMIRRGMDVDTIREISRLDLQRILELRSEITPWLSFSNWVGQLTKSIHLVQLDALVPQRECDGASWEDNWIN